MLYFDNVSFAYPGKPAIFRGLRVLFESGLLHAIIGPSGCGKTTLIYLAAGLLAQSDGQVSVAGEIRARGRGKTAVILQDHGLFPWKTAYENLILPLVIRGTDRQTVKKEAENMLLKTGLRGKENEYPHRLSGGEKQRLAVGRALIQDPDLLLLDEPFSSLDAMTREKMQDYLGETQQSCPTTMLLVTHSIEEAVFLSDRIHIMDMSGNLETIENKPLGSEARKTVRYFEQCRNLRERLERINPA